MAPLKVLINGGGIAGQALAFWLARIDADITIVERFPTLRAIGHQVDLRAQGIPLMQKMGIETAVRAAVVREPGTQLVDLKGKTKAFFPVYQTGTEKQGATSDFEIMRGDLVRILYDEIKDLKGVRYIFGTSMESFAQDDESSTGGQVHVRFEDGREEDYDFVVGADGIGSHTRKLMLGPDAPDPRHSLGLYQGFFTVPARPGDSDRATACHLPGRRILMTRRDRLDVLRVYMMIYGDDHPSLDAAYKSGDMEEHKKAWAGLFRGAGWQADRFMYELEHCPEADDLYSSHADQIRLPEGSWCKGRIVLLGDSAWCPTPLGGGLGATLGLVGAYVLAGEIASRLVSDRLPPGNAVVEGAIEYERKLRPLTALTQDVNKKTVGSLFPETTRGIWFLQSVAGLAAFFRLDQLGGLFSEKTSQWEIPEYPELGN